MRRQAILDRYFLDARHKLIDVAAFLDRVERGEGDADFRLAAFHQAVDVLKERRPDKAEAVLTVFSDPTDEPIAVADTQGACGAWPGSGKES